VKRRLFNLLAAVSLVLCVLVVALWLLGFSAVALSVLFICTS
jgi:hypothetical protein